MNITYVTGFPSIDIKYWSGTMYYMAKGLEERASHMDYITRLEEINCLSLRIKRRLYNGDKKYISDRSPETSKAYAKQILEKLDPNTDVIFSPGAIPLAYLKTEIPKIFYTDCTFASMIDYYQEFSNLSKKYIKEGMETEQRAMENCQLAIFGSEWAAESAVRDYGINPNKVRIIPLGANINTTRTETEVSNIIDAKTTDVCKIMFLGVDWHRKGGQLVLDTVAKLNEMGVPAEMHIVGLPELPLDTIPNFVVNHGFLNKNEETDFKKLEKLFKECHFMFVPSKAEAYGVVFCEAMSYGLPPISNATGGIPTIIKNNFNGIILPTDSFASEYAKLINKIFLDKVRYKDLAMTGYKDYKNRLNWDTAMQKVFDCMKKL